jgi:YegS/Rv2252/BmrU family lipid kinase
MSNVTIIYNPLAGPEDFATAIEQIAGEWRDLDWGVAIKPTEAPGHATKLAAEAAEMGCPLVLAAGGDGTLGEVVNGLAETETIMGILPAGTANSFARELQMPVPGALQMPIPSSLRQSKLHIVSTALMDGRVQEMDLGYRLGTDVPAERGRYWMLWASTGADGYLVHEVEPRPKWSKKMGWTSYLLQGISVLSNFSHVRALVEVDGYTLEDDYILVLVSNSRRYAGGVLTLSQEAYLDDGLLEIWLFGGRGLSSISRHGFRALRGQHLQEPDTILLRGRQISIVTDAPMPVQMDGDPVAPTPLECVVKPGALRLLVPDSAPVDLFQKVGVPLAEVVV